VNHLEAKAIQDS
jgi:hypothetical protein